MRRSTAIPVALLLLDRRRRINPLPHAGRGRCMSLGPSKKDQIDLLASSIAPGPFPVFLISRPHSAKCMSWDFCGGIEWEIRHHYRADTLKMMADEQRLLSERIRSDSI